MGIAERNVTSADEEKPMERQQATMTHDFRVALRFSIFPLRWVLKCSVSAAKTNDDCSPDCPWPQPDAFPSLGTLSVVPHWDDPLSLSQFAVSSRLELFHQRTEKRPVVGAQVFLVLGTVLFGPVR